MAALLVREYERMAEVPQLAWDAVVQASSMPIFYRWEWLDAFESATIERIISRRYFVVQEGDSFAAVLPAYCTSFSPFWHGYEIDANQEPVFSGLWVAAPSIYSFTGGIPSTGKHDPNHIVDLMLQAALDFAEEQGSQAFGLFNIPEGSPLLNCLTERTSAVVFLDTNHVYTLQGDFETYLKMLPKHVRDDLKRRRRRAADRGLECRFLEGTEGSVHLERFHALAIEPTDRHGIPPLYDLPTFRALASLPCARLLVGLHRDELVGGFLFFEDPVAIYVWAAAINYGSMDELSTYVALMYDIMAYAFAHGKQRIEFGRGNYSFKRKHGFQGIPLYSFFFPIGQTDPLLSKRLTSLHTNLVQFVERHGGVVPHAAS